MPVVVSSRLRQSTASGYEQLPGAGSCVGSPRSPAPSTPHSTSGGGSTSVHSPYKKWRQRAGVLLLVALGTVALLLTWQWHIASQVSNTAVTVSIATTLRQRAVDSLAALPGRQHYQQQQQQQRQGTSSPAASPSAGTAAAAANAPGQLPEGACAHTLGDWCKKWLLKRAPAVPVQPLPLSGKPCPNNCSSIGNCDGAIGVCYCPAAWGGPDCSQPVKRPCAQALGGLRRNPPVPYSHIGPDKLDLNLSNPVFSMGRCAGVCDDEYGRCYCRGPGKYGRIPAPEGSPPGTPPLQGGRPTHFPCSHPKTGPDGANITWGVGPTWQELYGPDGWCVADKASYTHCGCPFDGVDGVGCRATTEHTCFNQCAGRGKCVQQGFCHCPPGWYGVDCAYPSTAAAAAAAPAAAQQGSGAAPWVQHTAVDAWRCYTTQQGCLEDRVEVGWQQGMHGRSPSPPPSPSPSPPASNTTLCQVGGVQNGTAASCGGAAGGVPSSSNPPQNLYVGAASTAGTQQQLTKGRPRPLIYVYNIPDFVVSHVYQYRRIKESCGWRIYKEFNTTQILHEVYGIEVVFLDMLLGSQHRTLNPEEADYFYVPVLASCWMTYVQGEQDWPWFSVDSWSRVKGAMMMYQHALDFVKTTYPYWNASRGADHLWMFTHDEGACWAPAELYENSIVLTYWGRTTPDNHPSHTNYGQDNYSANVLDDPLLPNGSLPIIGHHRCYTPGKDIVVPIWKSPQAYESSPFLGAPAVPRDVLGFHRGRVMKTMLQYSLGVRQRLDAEARSGDWRGKHRIHVEEDQPGSYSQLLASSVFCFVMQGDGWSARFADAISHGCIPVIVMDTADPPFGAELDWAAISIKIPAADIPKIPQILQAVSAARVAAMQAAIERIWHRMVWLSHPLLSEQVAKQYALNQAKEQASQSSSSSRSNTSNLVQPSIRPLGLEQLQNDAFQTVIQVLHSRLAQKQRRRA